MVRGALLLLGIVACVGPARGGMSHLWGGSARSPTPSLVGRRCKQHSTMVPYGQVRMRMWLRGGGGTKRGEEDRQVEVERCVDGGAGEEGSVSRHTRIVKSRKRQASEDQGSGKLVYRPGGEMGMGSLAMMAPKEESSSEDGSTRNMTRVLEKMGGPIEVKLGDEPSIEDPSKQHWRSDWWNQEGVTRDDIMKYLRARDAERTPDANTEVELNEELSWAAQNGEMDKMRRLIDAGAEVNAGGAGGSSQWTALHHAAHGNQTEAVIYLIEQGARVNVTTWGRCTAMHWACELDNVEMTEALVSRGADMYALSANGETPYDVGYQDCERYLVSVGYSKERASNLKASVRFVAPQFPRDRDGELPYMNEVLGEPDRFCERRYMERKTRTTYHEGGRIILNTFHEEGEVDYDLGEADWKSPVHCNYDPAKDEEPSTDSDIESGSNATVLECDAEAPDGKGWPEGENCWPDEIEVQGQSGDQD